MNEDGAERVPKEGQMRFIRFFVEKL